MSTDDSPDGDGGDAGVAEGRNDVRDRLEQEADRAVEQFDERIVELLSWVLDTETRARIYVYLRKHPERTSEEVATGTGLYPSTVREALAALHAEGTVTRDKRESGGAGNNPYEYSAIAPSDLVGDVVEDVQAELNTVFNLDRYLNGCDETDGDTEAVTITVQDETTTRESDLGGVRASNEHDAPSGERSEDGSASDPDGSGDAADSR